MAAIEFPLNPTLYQEFTDANGVVWQCVSSMNPTGTYIAWDKKSIFLLKGGDTATGFIKGNTPVATNDFAIKGYVDNADALKLNLTGGTVTGQIKGITPTSVDDLTRKDYVDTKMVDVSDDTSPTLGGNLALGGFDIPVSPTTQTALNLKLSNVVEDTTPSLGGDLDCNGKQFVSSSYVQAANATPSSGATHTFNYDDGDYQKVTPFASGTLTLATSNFPTGKVCAYIFEIVNGGNSTISFPTAWKYAGGIKPTLTVSGTDSFMLIKDFNDIYTMYVLGLDIKVAP